MTRPRARTFKVFALLVALMCAMAAPLVAQQAASPTPRSEVITFAFDAAPVPVVIDAIVGKMLRRAYVVDPSLRDRTVTLRSTRPVGAEDALALLDQALRLAGAGLIERPDGSVNVLPTERLQGLQTTPSIAGQTTRVGSLLVVPLKFVPAKEMAKVLESIADRRAVVRVDEAREALVLSGDAQSLQTLADTIALFDVDWLRATSFELVPVRHASVEALTADVRRVLGGEGGLVGTQVELVPMPRLRAIMIVAKRADRTPSIRAWIERLDTPPPSDGRSVRFHGVKNLPAEEVAEALAGLLGAGLLGGGSRAQDTSPATDTTSSATPAPFPSGAGTGSSAAGLSLPSGVRIQAAPRVNGLLIYGTDAEHADIVRTVEQIDVAPVQIMVEATVAEVVLNDQLKYGVQWFFDTRDNATVTFSTADNGAVASSFPGFSYRFQGQFARAALNALATVTNVEVISSPQLVALSGQTARLQIGDQVPIVTQSASGLQDDARIVNNVEYRDTGVVLTVKPRAGSDGLVIVDIQQEVSDVAGTTTSGIDSPTIQQRRFETRVAIQDGETVALGGLIRASRNKGDTGVPGLSRIPLAGAAFRSRDNTSRRTELIVFLTPRVMRSRASALAVTQDMRERLNALEKSRFGQAAPQ
jgi:general secretion pathway protein D